MTFIDRLDASLLSLAEKTAKYYNWLTGKDNFALARATSLQGVIIFVILTTIAFYPHAIGMAFIGAINLYFGIRWHNKRLALIKEWERVKESEAQAEIKHIEYEEALRDLRIVSIAVNLFAFFIISILSAMASIGNLWMTGCAADYLAEIAVIYFISIEKPPYQKSQVKDWLTSLVTPPPILIPQKA